MDAELVGLDLIAPNIGDWSAKVRVVSKTSPRTGAKSDVKYQKILLADEEGHTVEAVIFKGDIELHEKTLQVEKTYIISNAAVSSVKEMFRNPLSTSNYQWTINARTSIRNVDEGKINKMAFDPVFQNLTEVRKQLQKNTLVSTLCVIIDRRPQRCVKINDKNHTLHDYAAIDKELKPVVVTLWNDIVSKDVFATLNETGSRPVVALMNFLVKPFFGITLASTSSSLVLDTFQTKDFADMENWARDSKDLIDTIVIEGGFFEEKIHEDEPIATVQDILFSAEHARNNVIVKGYIKDRNQKFFYMCCEECQYGTTGAYKSMFMCRICNANRIAKPRYRFTMNITDDTGDVNVILFGNEAERILGISAVDFYKQFMKDGEIPLDVVNGRLDSLLLKVKVRTGINVNLNQTHGQSNFYNVLALVCEEVHSGTQIPTIMARRLKKTKDEDFVIVADTVRRKRLRKQRKIVLNSDSDDEMGNQLSGELILNEMGNAKYQKISDKIDESFTPEQGGTNEKTTSKEKVRTSNAKDSSSVIHVKIEEDKITKRGRGRPPKKNRKVELGATQKTKQKD